MDEMKKIIRWLHRKGTERLFGVELVRVESGLRLSYAKASYGYRDVNLTLRVSGHLCELQLHLRAYSRLKWRGAIRYMRMAREMAIPIDLKIGQAVKVSTYEFYGLIDPFERGSISANGKGISSMRLDGTT